MENNKTLCSEGYVSRQGQKLLLEMLYQSRGTTAMVAGIYISREGKICVWRRLSQLKYRLNRYCRNNNIGRIVHPYSG